MYDVEKRKYYQNPTIADILYQLEMENKDSQISICGKTDFYLHCNEDNTMLTLDTKRLDDEYEDSPEIIEPENAKNNCYIPRFRLLELISKLIDTFYDDVDEKIIVEDLKAKGFSDIEILELGYEIEKGDNNDEITQNS